MITYNVQWIETDYNRHLFRLVRTWLDENIDCLDYYWVPNIITFDHEIDALVFKLKFPEMITGD
jgi:hypothetical protein